MQTLAQSEETFAVVAHAI
jgi:hypothetical protein